MRKVLAHFRWWLAYHIDPTHVISEEETLPMARISYYPTDPEDTDPRSTARPGEW